MSGEPVPPRLHGCEPAPRAHTQVEPWVITPFPLSGRVSPGKARDKPAPWDLHGRSDLLFRVFDSPDLSDHGDLDLPRVLELLLHLLGDVAGQDLGGQVVHIARLDHHPDLP